MRGFDKTLKRAIAIIGAGAMLLSVGACGNSQGSSSSGGKITIKFAAFKGGYGEEIYKDVVKAYEKENPNVKIDLTVSSKLGDEITPGMKAGNYPDIVEMGQGNESGLVETMMKDKAMANVTDVLDMKIPGEKKTVRDKLVPNIIGMYTNPYGGKDTYLMPMYYAPSGLVYNQTLLKQNGWTVPADWDGFFKLGDEARAKGLSLFTYPTAGYMNSVFNALLADEGGNSFYKDVMTYKKDVWKSSKAADALKIVSKLVSPKYLDPNTVGYANNQDFKKNQQAILEGKTLFMPNGTWVINEMKDAPRTDNFEWGFASIPGLKQGASRYINTIIEATWIPAKAKHQAEAKKFMAYLYSDKAAEIFSKTGAIQPIKGQAEKVTGPMKVFYDAMAEKDVKSITGNFSQLVSVEGKNIKDDLYKTIDSVATGKKSMEQWQDALNETSNALHDAAAKK